MSYSAEDADQCTSGLNFRTLRPRRDVLTDYREILARIYAPRAYFARARRVGRELDRSAHALQPSARNVLRDVRAFLGMLWLMGIRDRRVRREWWYSLFDCLLHNPAALKIVLSFAALYLHLGPYSRELVERLDREISTGAGHVFDAEAPQAAHAVGPSRPVRA